MFLCEAVCADSAERGRIRKGEKSATGHISGDKVTEKLVL